MRPIARYRYDIHCERKCVHFLRMNKKLSAAAIGLVLLTSACTPSGNRATLVHAAQPAPWQQIAVSNINFSSAFARRTSIGGDVQTIELLLNLKQQGDQQRHEPYMSIVETWTVICGRGVGQIVAESYFAKAMAKGTYMGTTDFVPTAAGLQRGPVVLELCKYLARSRLAAKIPE